MLRAARVRNHYLLRRVARSKPVIDGQRGGSRFRGLAGTARASGAMWFVGDHLQARCMALRLALPVSGGGVVHAVGHLEFAVGLSPAVPTLAGHSPVTPFSAPLPSLSGPKLSLFSPKVTLYSLGSFMLAT